ESPADAADAVKGVAEGGVARSAGILDVEDLERVGTGAAGARRVLDRLGHRGRTEEKADAKQLGCSLPHGVTPSMCLTVKKGGKEQTSENRAGFCLLDVGRSA